MTATETGVAVTIGLILALTSSIGGASARTHSANTEPPPVSIAGAADDGRDSIQTEGTGSAWKQGPDGREPANDKPKDRYARTDAVTCGTLGENLDA